VWSLRFPSTKPVQPSMFCLMEINEPPGSIAPTSNPITTGRRQSETRALAMTGKKSDEVLNMSHRTVLQYLSLTDWQLVDRLPIRAGELILSRLAHHGWIEIRGEKQHTEARLTPAGLKAMRSPIG
jgi:hypothetical protein